MTPDFDAAAARWLAAKGHDGEQSDGPDGGCPDCHAPALECGLCAECCGTDDGEDPNDYDRDRLDDR